MASFSLSIALLAIHLNAADSPGGKPASDTTAAPAAKAAAPAPPLRLGPLVVTGSIRSRFESWDWFESPGDSSYGYSGSILRLSVGQKINRMEWMLELAAPVLLGMPDGAVAPAPQGQLGLGGTYSAANRNARNAASVFAKQAFIRFGKLGANEAHSVRFGRFEFADGTEVVPKDAVLAAVKTARVAHRLIGNFGWTHVGRSLDGAQYVYQVPKGNVTVVAAMPTRGVFQTDGWGRLNTAFAYGAFTRPYGKAKTPGEFRLFGIYYDDWRGVLKTDNRALALRRADTPQLRIGTFGGHMLQAVHTEAGTFDLLAWGAGQSGTWGVQGHRGLSVLAEAGFQPAAWKKLRPWFRGGYSYGSGDNNANDNRHGTYFQLLPTPRPFARFPFYNMMNNKDAFGEVVLRPGKKLTLRPQAHLIRLAGRNDLWYAGGGAFQPWTFGFQGRPSGGSTKLANVYDISADYVVNPSVTLGFYYGRAQGLDVISAIHPKGTSANMGYIELGYKF